MKSIKIKWKILRKKLPFPTAKAQTEWTGSAVSPDWDNYDPSLSISGETSAIEPGTYTVMFTPDSNHCWMDGTYGPYETTWKLVRTIVNLDGIPVQDGTLTYTGETQYPKWKNYDSTKLTLEIAAQKDAGTYTATFTPRNGYAWPDGSETPKTIEWKIEPAKVDAPTQSFTSTPFTGATISAPIVGFDANMMVMSGATEGSASGEYVTLIELVDKDNYEWNGSVVLNASGQIEYKWTIAAQSIGAPTVTNKSFTYTGEAQGPTIVYADHMVISGVQAATDAGEYTIYFTPDDNYAWRGTVITDEQGRYVVTWTIEQIDSTITIDKDEVELTIENPATPGILFAYPTELNIVGLGEDYAEYVTVETNIPEGFDVVCEPEGIVDVEVMDTEEVA